MTTVKDGAKIALGFMLVKGVTLIGASIAIKVLESRREALLAERLAEREQHKQALKTRLNSMYGKPDLGKSAYPTGVYPFPFNRRPDNDHTGAQAFDIGEMIGELLQTLPTLPGETECTNPECFLHGENGLLSALKADQDAGINPPKLEKSDPLFPSWERNLMNDATGKNDNED